MKRKDLDPNYYKSVQYHLDEIKDEKNKSSKTDLPQAIVLLFILLFVLTGFCSAILSLEYQDHTTLKMSVVKVSDSITGDSDEYYNNCYKKQKCLNYYLERFNCSTAGDYDHCMTIRVSSVDRLNSKYCPPAEQITIQNPLKFALSTIRFGK